MPRINTNIASCAIRIDGVFAAVLTWSLTGTAKGIEIHLPPRSNCEKLIPVHASSAVEISLNVGLKKAMRLTKPPSLRRASPWLRSTSLQCNANLGSEQVIQSKSK